MIAKSPNIGLRSLMYSTDDSKCRRPRHHFERHLELEDRWNRVRVGEVMPQHTTVRTKEIREDLIRHRSIILVHWGQFVSSAHFRHQPRQPLQHLLSLRHRFTSACRHETRKSSLFLGDSIGCHKSGTPFRFSNCIRRFDSVENPNFLAYSEVHVTARRITFFASKSAQ